MFDDVLSGQLAPELAKALSAQGFEQLTPIQKAVLDPQLAARDLRLSSETGSGKTVALGLVLARSLSEDAAAAGVRALVVAPARELAQQLSRELRWLLASVGLEVAVVTGGAPYGPETRALRRNPAVVVGTPGRLTDHLAKGSLQLGKVRLLVLDEADQLLDRGFREELDALREGLPQGAGVHLVSATFGAEVRALADRYQRQDAAQVHGTEPGAANPNIRHTVHMVRGHDRAAALQNVLLTDPEARTMVFVATRAQTAELARALTDLGLLAQALSGELAQPERERRLAAFRSGKAPILVATDVAARGIDVPGVARVIQWGPPLAPAMFTHRAGRTGRAGAAGQNIVLATPAEAGRLQRCIAQAAVDARFEKVPSPAEVRRAAERRFTESLAATEQTPEHLELARALLDEHEPAALVAQLIARSGLIDPSAVRPVETLRPARRGAGDRLASRTRGADGRRPHHDPDRFVTLQMNWGARQGANPRRVTALMCRRGDVRSSQLGRMDIRPASTLVQVEAPVAKRVLAGFARPDPRDGHIRLRPHRKADMRRKRTDCA